jgi:hypothetical protein
MASAEELGQQAREQAAKQFDQHTVNLAKTLVPILKRKYGTNMPEPKTDEEYLAFGKGLIENDQIDVGDGKILTVDQLDDELSADEKLGGAFASVKSSMHISRLSEAQKAARTLKGELPEIVGRNVEGNTGWWEFIKNAFQGFIAWMTSGFEGGLDGLQQKIAGITANHISEGVKKDLNQLAIDKPETGVFLNSSSIPALAEQTRLSALRGAGFPDAAGEANAKDGLGQLFDVSSAPKIAVRDTLNSEIMTSLKETYKSSYEEGYWDKGKRFVGLTTRQQKEQEALKEASDGVSTRVSDIIFDKEYRFSVDKLNLSDARKAELAAAKIDLSQYEGKALSELTNASNRALIMSLESEAQLKTMRAALPESEKEKIVVYDQLIFGMPKVLNEKFVAMDKDIPWAFTAIVKADDKPIELPQDAAASVSIQPSIKERIVAQLNEQLKENPEQAAQLAKLLGVKEITAEQKDALAASVVDASMKIKIGDGNIQAELDKKGRKSDTDGVASDPEMSGAVYMQVRERMVAQLRTDADAGKYGIALKSEAIEVMADRATQQFMQVEWGQHTPPDAFVQLQANHIQVAQENIIEGQVRTAFNKDAAKNEAMLTQVHSGVPLTQEQKNALFQATSRGLAQINTDPAFDGFAKKSDGDKTSDMFLMSDRVYDQLAASKDKIGLDDKVLRIMADKAVTSYVTEAYGSKPEDARLASASPILPDSLKPSFTVPKEFQDVADKRVTEYTFETISGKISSKLGENTAGLSTLMKFPLNSGHFKIMGDTITQTLVPYVNDPQKLKALIAAHEKDPTKPDAYAAISTEITQSLMDYQKKNPGFFLANADYNNLRIIADQTAVNFVHGQMQSAAPDISGTTIRMMRGHYKASLTGYMQSQIPADVQGDNRTYAVAGIDVIADEFMRPTLSRTDPSERQQYLAFQVSNAFIPTGDIGYFEGPGVILGARVAGGRVVGTMMPKIDALGEETLKHMVFSIPDKPNAPPPPDFAPEKPQEPAKPGNPMATALDKFKSGHMPDINYSGRPITPGNGAAPTVEIT